MVTYPLASNAPAKMPSVVEGSSVKSAAGGAARMPSREGEGVGAAWV
jgi:hypothetical protein